MAQLAKALIALAAVAFMLAVVTNFTGNSESGPLLATAEGFSRASHESRLAGDRAAARRRRQPHLA